MREVGDPEGFVALLVGVLFFFSGCGGGGGSSTTQIQISPPPTNPDLALIFVSGHNLDDLIGLIPGVPQNSYLNDPGNIGPAMVDDLESAGFTVQPFYFVDYQTTTDMPGYVQLVEKLEWIRDNWAFVSGHPTRVVVVAHSHGGVWATAALRAVPDLPITAQIDLDHCSYGWILHSAYDDLIGGDPRNAYTITPVADYPTNYPVMLNEQGHTWDLEDVVMPSVLQEFEVRSGADTWWNPLDDEMFDEHWNVRLDGSLTGLTGYYSATDHTEVHMATGTTYPVVMNWLLNHL